MNKQITLSTPCYTVRDGKIVEGTLRDFEDLIETTARPDGVGPAYYATTLKSYVERDTGEVDYHGYPLTATPLADVWVVAKLATLGRPQIVMRIFGGEDDALAAAEQTYCYDILNDPDVRVHLDRAEAEQELADIAEQAASV